VRRAHPAPFAHARSLQPPGVTTENLLRVGTKHAIEALILGGPADEVLRLRKRLLCAARALGHQPHGP
jgi:hypothetical protein